MLNKKASVQSANAQIGTQLLRHWPFPFHGTVERPAPRKTIGDGSGPSCKSRVHGGGSSSSVGLAPLPEEEGHSTMTKAKLKEYDSSDSGFTEPQFIMEPSATHTTVALHTKASTKSSTAVVKSLSRCSTPRSRTTSISSTVYYLPASALDLILITIVLYLLKKATKAARSSGYDK